MGKRTWLGYAVAYASWLALLLLGLWLLAMAREVLLSLAVRCVTGSTLVRAHRVGLADKVFVVCAGLLWLTAVVVGEEYLRSGVERRDLGRRLALVAGPELLLLFAADLALVVLHGLGGWLRLPILAAELGAGVGLLRLAHLRLRHRPGQPASPANL